MLITACITALILCTVCIHAVFAAGERPLSMNDQQVKVVFLFNIIKYVSWPADSAAKNEIEIGVLGKITPGEAWSELRGKSINGKAIIIRNSSDLSDLSGCQVLFIQPSEQKNVQRIIAAIGNDPVLTVSDMDTFISNTQGIIRLHLKNERMTFSVNLKKARSAGLDISSRLLSLAAKVYQ